MTAHRHAPRGPLKTHGGADPIKNQCKATNRQGKRCGRAPIAGAVVCRMHGGAAPQVKAKAEERLRALELPAIDRMAQLISQTDFPSVAYQASKDILDRLRGRATEHIDAKVSNVTGLSDEALIQRARELASGAESE